MCALRQQLSALILFSGRVFGFFIRRSYKFFRFSAVSGIYVDDMAVGYSGVELTLSLGNLKSERRLSLVNTYSGEAHCSNTVYTNFVILFSSLASRKIFFLVSYLLIALIKLTKKRFCFRFKV